MKDESIMSLKVTNGEIIHYSALSVLDYFAAKAASGLLAHPDCIDIDSQTAKFVAKEAYMVADAMLKERAK